MKIIMRIKTDQDISSPPDSSAPGSRSRLRPCPRLTRARTATSRWSAQKIVLSDPVGKKFK